MQKHTLTNNKKIKRTYYQKHQTKQNNENKIKTATITRRPLSQDGPHHTNTDDDKNQRTEKRNLQRKKANAEA